MDRWNLPGGGVLSGETPWQAVVREVQEEVGQEVAVINLLGVYAYPPDNDVIFSFLCTVAGGYVTMSDEADAVGYFSFGELPTTTHAHHLLRVKDALEEPDQVQLKTLPLLPKAEFSRKDITS